MTRKKKILLSISTVLALLLVMMVALPFLFKDKIIEIRCCMLAELWLQSI